MKAQRIIGIIIIVIGLYLEFDAVGEYGAADNHSEIWLGGICFIVGLFLSITKKNII